MVSIAANQSIIQTVVGLQHVAYADSQGVESHYLYVFGNDATGAPYFGVGKLSVAGPANPSNVATALASMEVSMAGQRFTGILDLMFNLWCLVDRGSGGVFDDLWRCLWFTSNDSG